MARQGSEDGSGSAGPAAAREQRLAARLRENLGRRKRQARAREADDSALSKPPPKS
jgi:hypothetical protein